MSDDRRRKNDKRPASAPKETSADRPTYSSPDRFRQDTIEERKKQVAEIGAREELDALRRAKLKMDIEDAKGKTRDATDRKTSVVEAHDRPEDAGSFAKKTEEREKARREAMEKGGPESPAKGIG